MLLTYNEYNRDLGYVQGMSDLLAPIYAVMQDDAVAFWGFVGFMGRMVSQKVFNREQSLIIYRKGTFYEISPACVHNYSPWTTLSNSWTQSFTFIFNLPTLRISSSFFGCYLSGINANLNGLMSYGSGRPYGPIGSAAASIYSLLWQSWKSIVT